MRGNMGDLKQVLTSIAFLILYYAIHDVIKYFIKKKKESEE